MSRDGPLARERQRRPYRRSGPQVHGHHSPQRQAGKLLCRYPVLLTRSLLLVPAARRLPRQCATEGGFAALAAPFLGLESLNGSLEGACPALEQVLPCQ